MASVTVPVVTVLVPVVAAPVNSISGVPVTEYVVAPVNTVAVAVDATCILLVPNAIVPVNPVVVNVDDGAVIPIVIVLAPELASKNTSSAVVGTA